MALLSESKFDIGRWPNGPIEADLGSVAVGLDLPYNHGVVANRGRRSGDYNWLRLTLRPSLGGCCGCCQGKSKDYREWFDDVEQSQPAMFDIQMFQHQRCSQGAND